MKLNLIINYQDITNEICQLVEKSNVWSSTIVIPDGDNILDISSSAAIGASLITPIDATKQPGVYPKGKVASVYQFDPDIHMMKNSWPKLKSMITKIGCVSGC
jgi:hypothetical protein